jgi:Domain of unknown function (DUF5134)
MTGWTALAALLCLGTGLTCLALAATGVGDRPAQLTHAVMGVAMAGMFSPWGDPLPAWAGAVGFAVLGAWFVAAVLRGARDQAVHLAISSAAMVLMYLTHHHGATAAGAPGSGPHAGHVMTGGGPTGLLVMPLTLVLAGYFVWHAWTCVDRARCTRTGPDSAARATATRPRVEPVVHGVMSALMAAMFLGVV